MVQGTAGSSSETTSAGTDSSGRSGEGSSSGIDDFINALIERVEIVADHFSYTEEYVLSHTPAWLQRKFKQAQKQRFDDHQTAVLGRFQSALLVLDVVFNKGRDFNKIMPASLEEMQRIEQQKTEVEGQFVAGVWWKKSDNSGVN